MLDRRCFLAGAAAAGFVRPALADGPAVRRFRILRGGDDIGRHALNARLTDRGFEIDIDIDIRVRVFGITAYRYELTNREVWSGGRLVSLSSTTNDDGDRAEVRLTRSGDRLEIDGSAYSGTVGADAATTSYFTPAFLERRPWLSTQSGKPLTVETASRGGGRWQVTGDLTTTLIYDDRGEWMGSEFDAEGERASYEVIEDSGRIAALWEQA